MDDRIKELDRKSETVAGQLETIEPDLSANDEIKNASVTVRKAFFAIKALERQGANEGTLQADFNKWLDKFDRFQEELLDGDMDELAGMKQLFDDLGNLATSTGQKLRDLEVDGSFIEAMDALYEGMLKAGEKILEELIDTLKLLVSPEELALIADGLLQALKDPVTFINIMITFFQTEYQHAYREIKAMKESLSNTGFAVEMSRFIPETGIPIIIQAIGHGKFVSFLKLLKIDKILPASVLQKLPTEARQAGTAERGGARAQAVERGAARGKVQLPKPLSGEFSFESKNIAIGEVSNAAHDMWKFATPRNILNDQHFDSLVDASRKLAEYVRTNASNIAGPGDGITLMNNYNDLVRRLSNATTKKRIPLDKRMALQALLDNTLQPASVAVATAKKAATRH